MVIEQAGLEVMSGCLGLFALAFVGAGAGIVQIIGFAQRQRTPSERRHLDQLLLEFCTGADQSNANVNQIQAILMTSFAQDSEYEELTTAAASFSPGGLPPFHNEAWLADKFSLFLRNHGVFVPEQVIEEPGVWPPPPNLSL